MSTDSTCRTEQASNLHERGQTIYRVELDHFIDSTGPQHSVITVGVLPAAGAAGTDVSYFRFPDGISGRILRFGAYFCNQGLGDSGFAVGDVEGTFSLDMIAVGGAAFANIANIVWPQAAPVVANALPNDATYEDVTVGAVPPQIFAGGDLLAAYISAARVIAAGVDEQGECVGFVDYIIDNIIQDATAAVVAYIQAQ